ncbi:MAG: phosphotransferase family protein [Candidatus Limnocylindria bacterium]
MSVLSTAERRRQPLSRGQLVRLRDALEPDATDVSARPLVGGVDTATYALRLGRDEDEVVVRVYRDWEGDAAAAVRREFAVLTAVAAVTALAPRPIIADPAGDLIGEPLIVMSFLPGAPQAPTGQDDAWVEQLAVAMADVHATPIERLPNDFPRHGTAEERLERFLDRGADVRDPLWDEIAATLTPIAAQVKGNPPTLIHSDFWFGNTIWQDGRLTGIIDWDGAAIGDPARDVAGARNDLALLSGAAAADVFLARYASERGPLRDLAFWDLLTSLPPIRWLSHWVEGYTELGLELSLAEARARLESHVADALGRLGRSA